MQVIIWIVVGLLVSVEAYRFMDRRKMKDRERRLKDFILDDARLRELYLRQTKSGAGRASS